MKKALAIIFYDKNVNENLNADETIININNYLEKGNLAQNKNFIDQENSNIEPLNPNTGKSLKNLLANAYEKNKLV